MTKDTITVAQLADALEEFFLDVADDGASSNDRGTVVHGHVIDPYKVAHALHATITDPAADRHAPLDRDALARAVADPGTVDTADALRIAAIAFSDGEPELAAMAVIIRELGPLSVAAQGRVLRYVSDRRNDEGREQ